MSNCGDRDGHVGYEPVAVVMIIKHRSMIKQEEEYDTTLQENEDGAKIGGWIGPDGKQRYYSLAVIDGGHYINKRGGRIVRSLNTNRSTAVQRKDRGTYPRLHSNGLCLMNE